MRRFLHLIEKPDGSACCIWQELQGSEVEFSIMRTDIHCTYAIINGPFAPDHCLDADEVRLLVPPGA